MVPDSERVDSSPKAPARPFSYVRMYRVRYDENEKVKRLRDDD